MITTYVIGFVISVLLMLYFFPNRSLAFYTLYGFGAGTVFMEHYKWYVILREQSSDVIGSRSEVFASAFLWYLGLIAGLGAAFGRVT